MNANQNLIHNKLKEFIKKYYLNKLYKGAILFVMITLLTFIVYSVLEYFSYFNSIVRSVFFFSFLVLFLSTLIFYVLIPLFKIWGFGKQISNEQVAAIVGKHFPEIDDKLLNVIQLERQLSDNEYKSHDLLVAAIDTKILEIKPFLFIKAIPFHKSRKYLKWAAIPIFLFIVIFSIKSEVFTDSTRRIVNYQQYYEKPAPYQFEIMNPKLMAFQHEDFTLKIKVNGEETPENIFVVLDNKSFKCNKNSNIEFSYTFFNVQKNAKFQISTDEVTSKPYTLNVLPKPVTVSFILHFSYPDYLNKNDDIIDNNGDATVPEGTKISWKFYTKNTSNLIFNFNNHSQNFVSSDDVYTTALIAKTSFDYNVVNSNRYFTSKDTLSHTITVIKDLYPEIYVESQKDSLFADRIYFKGNIKDDYGFNNLKFVYSKFDEKNNLLESNKSIDIQINKQKNIQDFYYYFDAGTLQLTPGQRISYHFEVRDNDGVNGSKMSQSLPWNFQVKTMEEIDKDIESSNSKTKSEIETLINESSDLIKEIDKLNKQILQNNTSSWQDKKKLEKLLEEYDELKNKINELKEKQGNQQAIEDLYKEITPEILKKQNELQKRFDDILSDELKDLMNKMKEMINQQNKDQMKDAMDKMKLKTEEINKSLDQQLQLFKQLEFEKKYNDVIEKAQELSQEEKLLSNQTEQKNIDKNILLKKQQDVENKFNQLQENIQGLQSLNKELEDPNKMTDTRELQNKITQSMQESKSSLNKNNRGKATEKQNEAAEDIDKLADQMENDKLDSDEENISEDIVTLRQILDNLILISFQQEDNMKSLQEANVMSPRLSEVIRTQYAIKDNMRLIEDSLSALARRQTAVKPFIQKEVSKINDYILQSQNNINDRQLTQAATNQQFALTSMNNLSLMLAESMKEMKKKESECKNCKNKKSGKGSCNKPGGKGKPKSAKELQQQLNRQMEALKRSMDQKGENNPGQAQQQGQQNISEQLARMAAQQEAIRKMMQDYQNQLKSENGVGDKSLEQTIKDMETTEKELVNRILSQQTINRQKNIETRLLESEKADMQREKEEKRESVEGKDIRNPNPPKEWKIDKENEKQTEMLKTVPPSLNYYYKEKVNKYFFNIE
jgi:hypothetical protein